MVKHFEINGIGKIRVQKRRGSKTMRIKISQEGTVTVVVPYWVPYRAALEFAKKQHEWIQIHTPHMKYITNGQTIGKTHIIHILRKDVVAPRIKVEGTDVFVTIPLGFGEKHETVQKVAKRAAKRALALQAHILEDKLRDTAKVLCYEFTSVSYKFMRSKWGSCNTDKHITLNYRLLDLPEHLIDYVIIHELVHLNHMNHSTEYWKEIQSLLPDYKDRKLQLRSLKLEW